MNSYEMNELRIIMVIGQLTFVDRAACLCKKNEVGYESKADIACLEPRTIVIYTLNETLKSIRLGED